MAHEQLTLSIPPLSQNDLFYIDKMKLSDARGLNYKFELSTIISCNEINELIDQMLQTARIHYMDEIEIYFAGDEDLGPFSSRNEIESLNLLLRMINSVESTASNDKLKILKEIKKGILANFDSLGNQDLNELIIDEKNEIEGSLLKWGEINGVQSKLNIAYFEGAGRGLIASEDLSIGENAIEIPESLIISEDLVFKSDMYNVLKDLEEITSETMILLWSMRERFNSDSKFKLYFQTLPENFQTGLSFGIEALSALQGTLLFEELMQAKEHLRQQYDTLFPSLSTNYPNIFQKEIFTYNKYLWACELWYSNSMKVIFSDGKLKTCLVPIAGLLNHSLSPHILHYGKVDSITKCLKFPLSRPCKKGEQCFLSYGSFPSSHFFTFYGFIPKGDNIYDFIPLDFDAQEEKSISHMVRGTWLSKSSNGLPPKLISHLRNLFNCNSTQSNIDVDREVFEMLLSVFNPMLDELVESDETDKENAGWDLKMALEFKELQKRIISSVVASCDSVLEELKP
ncbi:hypothetical protein LUZ60_008866 [Juncus effusus]|nr:hypothetical protein LUZ60_008866 [Juncus effusus]